MTKVPNQNRHWNKLHQERTLDKYSSKPTDFAKEVAKILTKNSSILELGCGLGNDALFFAKKEHQVTATDFSELVIGKNRSLLPKLPNLSFQVLDISKPFKVKKQFDIVYARLSLHYFSDSITKKVFARIFKILKPKGILCFVCKSTNDPLSGKGKKLAKDMYVYQEHIRHFFSEKYIKECLSNYFIIEKIREISEDLYGQRSAFIEVIARKK